MTILYFVYRLHDPRTHAIRYVGITGDPDLRLYQHMNDLSSNEAKNQWIRELTALGLKPAMEIIERLASRKDAEIRERYWIGEYHNQGRDLLNINHHPVRKPSRQVMPAVSPLIQYRPYQEDFNLDGLTPLFPATVTWEELLMDKLIRLYNNPRTKQKVYGIVTACPHSRLEGEPPYQLRDLINGLPALPYSIFEIFQIPDYSMTEILNGKMISLDRIKIILLTLSWLYGQNLKFQDVEGITISIYDMRHVA